MLRVFFLVLVAIFFSSCSALTYTYQPHEKSLVFKKTKESFYTVQLLNPKVINTYDSCALGSYILQDKSPLYGNIFIEHISLMSNCLFNSDTFGLFIYEFKEQLKLKSLKPIETIKHNNYEFYAYKTNDEKIVNFIFIYSPFEYTFLVDYNGKLYEEVVKQFDALYESPYLDSERFQGNYNYSLVKMNVFKAYFTRMSEDYSSR
ncbi:MAG: hypothetical protein WC141_08850 [Arcobacteraceae bacterium]